MSSCAYIMCLPKQNFAYVAFRFWHSTQKEIDRSSNGFACSEH